MTATQKEQYFFERFIEFKELNNFSFFNKKNHWSPADFQLLSGDSKFLGEIKVRKYKLSFFENGNYLPFIQHNKLMGLLKQKKALQALPENLDSDEFKLIFFNFTKDGYLQIYLIDEEERNYNWEYLSLPTSNEDPTLISKKIAYLTNPIELIDLKR